MKKQIAYTFVLAAALIGGCKKKPPTTETVGSGSNSDMMGSGSATAPAGSGSAMATATGSGSGSDSGSGSAVTADPNRTTVTGFSTPESVLYDADSDSYLVSNINGKPAEADGNGFISRVSPDGKITELKWIEGGKNDAKLDAPKGMGISKGVLYVADISVVRMFDAKTGKAKGDIKVDGATFLNDITASDAGVFVSDMGVDGAFKPTGTDAIYKLADGKATPLIKNKDLGMPNGVAMAGKSVFTVTFGTGEIVEINEKGEKQPGAKLPKGQLDGVIAREGGDFLVSSWEGKAVYAGKGADWKAVVENVTAPADIGWDTKRKVLLVPQFQDNQILLIKGL